MKKFAYSFPIPKEKIDEWLKFAEEVNTTRRMEFTKMHARIGVTKESWYVQERESGYDLLVYTEAKDEHFMRNFEKDHSEFSEWLRNKVAQLQNIDLNTKVVMPKIVLDWSE